MGRIFRAQCQHLTPRTLENWLEGNAGVEPAQGGFLLHYFDKAGLSGYFFNHANDCGGNHLRSESCVLWPTGLDRREGRIIGLKLDLRSQ
jgi:hypothetical protein